MSDEQEIWKTYPDYLFIQVSNLGRVRTVDRTVECKNGRKLFVKGRFLKQQRDRYGYMFVQFSINGKRVTLKTHRMVAICFIPNPDNLPQVNHIDCNRSNNIVSNLEWCDNQYNTAYREKHGKASSRPVLAVNVETGEVLYFKSRGEAERKLNIPHQAIFAIIKGQKNTFYGWWFTEDESEITEERIKEIKANMRSRQVTVVNLRTMKVLRFETRKKASQQLNVSVDSISLVIKGKRPQAGGYLFTKDESEITKEKIQEAEKSLWSKTIFAINSKTLELFHFNSQIEASHQLNINAKRINNVLRGWQKTTCRYSFYYANENAVNNTRTEFGDDIANEVEKFMRDELRLL